MFIASGLHYYHLYSPCHLPKHRLKRFYGDEENAKTKERMLLVLNVVYQDKISVHVARDLHRNRIWAVFG